MQMRKIIFACMVMMQVLLSRAMEKPIADLTMKELNQALSVEHEKANKRFCDGDKRAFINPKIDALKKRMEELDEFYFQAIKEGDTEKVAAFLAMGYSNHSFHKYHGWTPLLLAAVQGHTKIMHLLLEHTINIDVPVLEHCVREVMGDSSRSLAFGSPLTFTAMHNCPMPVQILLDHKADVNWTTLGEGTSLHYAAQGNCTEVIPLLLKYKANINRKDKEGRMPLHYAAIYDCPEAAQILLDHKAQVNCKDQEGNAPLIHAIKNKHISVVKVLLNHKEIDFNCSDKAHNTALSWAVGYDELYEIVQMLLENKALVNCANVIGMTPLHYCAAEKNCSRIIKILLEYGADINKIDNGGNTPLHFAAGYTSLEGCKELIQAGASINRKNNEGKSALEIMESCTNDDGDDSKERTEIVELITAELVKEQDIHGKRLLNYVN